MTREICINKFNSLLNDIDISTKIENSIYILLDQILSFRIAKMDKEVILNNFYNNLDVLARMQDGHKLYLDKEQLLQLDEPFMFQGIWRYCYGISRKDAIHLLTKLFNDIEIYMNALYLRNIDVKNNIRCRYR